MKFLPVQRFFIILLLGLFFLTACDGITQEERLIAAYPRSDLAEARLLPISQTSNVVIVHTAYLEMEVNHLQTGMARIENLVYEQGGYLSSEQSWYADGREQATLVFAVPLSAYESTYRSLQAVGRLTRTRVSETVLTSGYGLPYSQFTLSLTTGRPVRTITVDLGPTRDGLDSFLLATKAVLAFVYNLASRLLTVLTPLVLIGLGLYLLLGRQKEKKP